MISGIKENLKLGSSLLRYGFQMKTNMILLVLFTVIGIVEDFGSKGDYMMGLYFLAIVSMYISQFLNGVCMSAMAQSSPYKHEILVEIPTIFHALISGGFFVLVVVLRFLYSSMGDLSILAIAGPVMFSVMSIMISCYNLLIYRFPVVGYAFLAVIIMALTFGGTFNVPADMPEAQPGYLSLPIFSSLTTSIVAGIVILILDVALFYGLSVVLYKKSLSRAIFKRAIASAKK
ncbi:MAG: hypothetical protein K6G57_00730 [Lachnospiraceae bacterium]|nr:hypothetical protein [Lachnospiraceae bacterium]